MIIFKHSYDRDRFFLLAPELISILSYLNWALSDNNIPFVITSTMSSLKEDLKLKRISDTHRTGRAVDIRIRDWTDKQKDYVKDLLDEEIMQHELGAVNEKGEQRLYVFKKDHLHIQVHRNFSVNNPL